TVFGTATGPGAAAAASGPSPIGGGPPAPATGAGPPAPPTGTGPSAPATGSAPPAPATGPRPPVPATGAGGSGRWLQDDRTASAITIRVISPPRSLPRGVHSYENIAPPRGTFASCQD